MNITDQTPLMLRRARQAAASDMHKARRQWPYGVAVCVMAMGFMAVMLWS